MDVSRREAMLGGAAAVAVAAIETAFPDSAEAQTKTSVREHMDFRDLNISGREESEAWIQNELFAYPPFVAMSRRFLAETLAQPGSYKTEEYRIAGVRILDNLKKNIPQLNEVKVIWSRPTGIPHADGSEKGLFEVKILIPSLFEDGKPTAWQWRSFEIYSK